MLELRWVQVPETTADPPRLQYRIHLPVVDAGGNLCPGDWTEWRDTPTVIVPAAPTGARDDGA